MALQSIYSLILNLAEVDYEDLTVDGMPLLEASDNLMAFFFCQKKKGPSSVCTFVYY